MTSLLKFCLILQTIITSHEECVENEVVTAVVGWCEGRSDTGQDGSLRNMRNMIVISCLSIHTGNVPIIHQEEAPLSLKAFLGNALRPIHTYCAVLVPSQWYPWHLHTHLYCISDFQDGKVFMHGTGNDSHDSWYFCCYRIIQYRMTPHQLNKKFSIPFCWPPHHLPNFHQTQENWRRWYIVIFFTKRRQNWCRTELRRTCVSTSIKFDVTIPPKLRLQHWTEVEWRRHGCVWMDSLSLTLKGRIPMFYPWNWRLKI